MDWYYVLDNQQKGPVGAAELQRLIQVGVLTRTALVWREGMSDWQPYHEVAEAQVSPGTGASGGGGGIVCAECGQTFGLEEVVRLPNGYVCATCKPIAMQKLSEGITDTTAAQIRQEHIKHEASVKSVGFLYFLGAPFFIVIGGMGTAVPGRGAMLAALFVAIGVALIWIGVGLRKLKSWARIPTGILSGIGLIGSLVFPLGFLIHGYVLYLILSRKGAMVFSDEYKQVIEQTPHIKYKTSIVVWILLVVLIALLVFSFIGILLAPKR